MQECAEYQVEDFPEDLCKDQVDSAWVEISKLTDTESVPRFPNLPKVMLSILTIPYSNASCERIFSWVRKNKTHQRSSMTAETLHDRRNSPCADGLKVTEW